MSRILAFGCASRARATIVFRFSLYSSNGTENDRRTTAEQ